MDLEIAPVVLMIFLGNVTGEVTNVETLTFPSDTDCNYAISIISGQNLVSSDRMVCMPMNKASQDAAEAERTAQACTAERA